MLIDLNRTYSCCDHEPVIQSKCANHSYTNENSQQTRKYGRGQEGNVDAQQFGPSVWYRHVDVVRKQAVLTGRRGAPRQDRILALGLDRLL